MVAETNKFEVVPIHFECTDDAEELIFTVKAFNANCASVDIKVVVTPDSWPEISQHILDCLIRMKLKG